MRLFSVRLTPLGIGAVAVLALPFVVVAVQKNFIVLEHPAIRYYDAEITDSIAQLQKRMESGEVHLDADQSHGHLSSLLRAVDIDVSSQVLVTSKTSLQVNLISPATPRAIYFNDDTYVAWVQGSPLLEISTVDPRLGAVFYTLDERAAGEAKFKHESALCLQCHNPAAPGHVMISTIPDDTGVPLYHAGLFTTTDQSPLEERWGGWYVTGAHGQQLHMGNLIIKDLPPAKPGINTNRVTIDRRKGANVTDLAAYLDTSKYLSGQSDIVALMVMGHQIHVQNQMTKLNYAARKAIYDANGADVLPAYKDEAEELVKDLLLVGETRLTSKITGTSGFTDDFQRRGPRDSKGRSLRELDLSQRLFRYPLSYLIYSKAFAELPAPARGYVCRRLVDILTGQDVSPDFRNLASEDRQEILPPAARHRVDR
jgi:hypothetical protein